MLFGVYFVVLCKLILFAFLYSSGFLFYAIRDSVEFIVFHTNYFTFPLYLFLNENYSKKNQSRVAVFGVMLYLIRDASSMNTFLKIFVWVVNNSFAGGNC